MKELTPITTVIPPPPADKKDEIEIFMWKRDFERKEREQYT